MFHSIRKDMDKLQNNLFTLLALSGRDAERETLRARQEERRRTLDQAERELAGVQKRFIQAQQRLRDETIRNQQQLSDLDRRIVARQLRRSILLYMSSEAFRPSLSLDEEVLRHLYEREAPPVNMFTNDSPDELKPKFK